MSKRSISVAARLYSGLLFVVVACMLGACSSLPEPGSYEKVPSYTLRDNADTTIARAIRDNYPGPLTTSGFYPLLDGMDAFVARMLIVGAAERSLDVQYYMWHGDTSGALLANALIKAARRGVRVRVLLDDLQVQGKDRFLSRLDANPNIEVRLYNPFAYRGSRGIGFMGDLKRLNHRMHNKSLTADNSVTVVGGRNIGNEYFNAVAHTTFADLDVIGIGPIVTEVSTMFDQYWNSDVAIPLAAVVAAEDASDANIQLARDNFDDLVDVERESDYVQALRDSHVGQSLRFKHMEYLWGDATLIYDDPNKVFHEKVRASTHLAPQLAPMFNDARREIQIVSPYFVPGDHLVAYFSHLVERGVRVRVLTNSLAANDVGLVHAGYMRYRRALLEGGVELYEYKAKDIKKSDKVRWSGSSSASLHAKTMGADGERIFIGSFNLDPRSVALNTEMGVIIDNPELGAQLEQGFDTLVQENAYQVKLVDGDLRWFDLRTVNGSSAETGEAEVAVFDREPATGWWQRFMARTLSVIVPESML